MLKLLILGMGLLSLAQAWKTYSGYRTYKVTPQTEEQVILLRQLLDEDIELDEWKASRGVGHEAHVMVSPEKRLSFAETMVSKGFGLDVHMADVGEDVADLKARLDARRKPDGRMDFELDNYNTVADTFDQLSVWQSSCPNGVTCGVQTIGNSHLGVNTLMFTMSSDTATQSVYIDSLTHAREILTGATVNNMIHKMVNDYETDDDVQHLVDNYNWYFVPIMNPDGYQYALDDDVMWRKNREPNTGSGCVGTDLNRNFDTGAWGRDGTSNQPCSDTYGGPSAASAPETEYVQAKLDEVQPEIVISIHSYANMWLQPYGHSESGGNSPCEQMDSIKHNLMLDAGQAAIDAIMAVGGQSWVRGTVCEIIYPASGGTVDYAEVNGGAAYSYTPELRGNSFNPPATQITPAFEETWAGIVALIYEAESH